MEMLTSMMSEIVTHELVFVLSVLAIAKAITVNTVVQVCFDFSF